MSTEISEAPGSAAHRAPLLDTDDVAKVLCVTPRHVRRLVSERRIPFVKVGRFVRFDPGALEIWLEHQCVEVRWGLRAPGQASR